MLVIEGVDHAIHQRTEELGAALRAQLGPAAIPARLAVVAALPRLEGGKPDLRKIADLVS